MSLTITTDNKWRSFVYAADVPQVILERDFDHLKDQDGDFEFDGYFKYRRRWYHITDFSKVEGHPEFQGWSGYHNDSYFSGILIKVSSDGEQYQVATFIS